MIETKHLIAYMRKGNKSAYSHEEQYEYSEEIVARLEERDEIVAGIKEMIKQICRDVNLARESDRLDK